MKRDPLFEECLANVSPELMEEVSFNIDIANRICDILKVKGMSQRELAARMGKKESEISRWLTGSHGFTSKTLSAISVALGERIVDVQKKNEPQYVFISQGPYTAPIEEGNRPNKYSNHQDQLYA